MDPITFVEFTGLMTNASTRLKIAVSGFSLSILGCGLAYAAVPQTEYDTVIRAARDGQAASAAEKLQAWHSEYPQDQKILHDLVVVLGWAGNFEGALALSAPLMSVNTPAYVLKSLGYSALSSEHWDDADKSFRLVLRTTPDDIGARGGLVRAMLGRHQYDEALQYAQSFLPDFSSAYQSGDVPMIMLLAFVRERRAEALYAADAYQNVLRFDPQSREALRGYVFALGRAGMPYLAARVADRRLDLFSTEERRQIAHTLAGRTVIFGEAQLSVDEKPPRFATTETALDQNANVLKRFGDRPETQFDRMVALRDRQLMMEVVQLYTALRAAGVAMPAYAKAAAADAYLFLEQPETARELYSAAIADVTKGDIANVDSWRIGLAYAYSEAEQHDEAQSVADGVLTSTPTLINKGTASIEASNGDYTTATITAALVRLYADRLEEAEKRLAALRKIAPFNGQTRLAWAGLQSAREHPRAALEEFTLVQLDDPKSVAAQVGRGDTLLALNQFSAAKAISEPLLADYPEDKGVQNLARQLEIHDRPFLKISTTLGKGGNAAGAESVYEVQLYSAPLTNSLGEPYRVFTHVSRSSGSIAADQSNNDNVPRLRTGVGVDYRVRDLTVEVEANRAVENASGSGLALQLTKDLSDSWHVRLAADSNVNDLSSAAYDNDVTARRITAGITWQKNESRSIDAELSNTGFSDGNRRDALGLTWTERWVSGPVFKLDSALSLATSRSSARDVPYFNPASDQEATVTLIAEWRTWRRYRRSFTQQLQVFAGRYWQQDFQDGATSGAQYGHQWDIDGDFTLGYGLGISTHPYDGIRDQRHYGYLNLTWAIK